MILALLGSGSAGLGKRLYRFDRRKLFDIINIENRERKHGTELYFRFCSNQSRSLVFGISGSTSVRQIQGAKAAILGRPITGDSYSALPYGPAPNRVLCLLDGLEKVALEGDAPMRDEVAELAKHFDVFEDEYSTYHAKSEPDVESLSQSDMKVLDHFIGEHGRKTFNELKILTHNMKAYTSVWRDKEVRRKYPMAFEDFFADVPDKAEFLKELQENQQLRQAFPDEVCV